MTTLLTRRAIARKEGTEGWGKEEKTQGYAIANEKNIAVMCPNHQSAAGIWVPCALSLYTARSHVQRARVVSVEMCHCVAPPRDSLGHV